MSPGASWPLGCRVERPGLSPFRHRRSGPGHLVLCFSSFAICYVHGSTGINDGQGVSHRNRQFQLSGELRMVL